MCFPGGKSDPHDQDEIHTALREASEEISLSPDEVEVVCKICPVMNQVHPFSSDYHVRCYIDVYHYVHHVERYTLR